MTWQPGGVFRVYYSLSSKYLKSRYEPLKRHAGETYGFDSPPSRTQKFVHEGGQLMA